MWEDNDNNNQSDLFGDVSSNDGSACSHDNEHQPLNKQYRKALNMGDKSLSAVKAVAKVTSDYRKNQVSDWLAPRDHLNTASYAQNEVLTYGYVPTITVGCLPHKEHKDCLFETTNGRDTFRVQSYPDVGLPYGKYPRLIIPFLVKHAKMQIDHKKASADPQYPLEVYLGKNFNEFLSIINIEIGGGSKGKNGTYHRVADQLNRLLMTRFSIKTENETHGAFRHLMIVTQGSYRIDHDAKGNVVPDWGDGRLILSNEFYKEAISHSLPVDLRVMFQLRSSFQMDLYTWLQYRLNRIDVPLYLSWGSIKSQFGNQYANTPSGLAAFKQSFKEGMGQVINAMTTYDKRMVTQSNQPQIVIKSNQVIIYPLPKLLRLVENDNNTVTPT